MKKFIIIVVFIFLISILISFNYLLWDREKQMENFQDMSASKNLSIEALGEKINSLDKSNKTLQDQINTLNGDNIRLKDDYSTIFQDRDELKKKIQAQNQLLANVKKSIDTKPIEEVLNKWAQALNKKNYSAASSLISAFCQDEKLSNLTNFKNVYQDNVKNITIKEIKPFSDLVDEDHANKIQFLVTLKVDVPTSSKQDYYKNGVNRKYFTMDYDSEQNKWFISEISDMP